MNAQQLAYFLAVAEHGSLGHAATAMNVAQPSLSQALGALEREMGTPLLHRLNRGAVLTPAGRVFVPHARRLLRELRRARDVVDQCGGVLAGVLDLVTTPLLAVDPGAGLLGRFRTLHPDVRVRVHMADEDAEVPGMLTGARAEVALTYLPLNEPGLAVEELGVHELLAVLPPGGPDLPDPLPVRELADRETVSVTGGGRQRQLVVEHLAAHGVRLRVVAEVAHREMVVPLVLAGAGMSFLPGKMAEWAAGQGARTRRLDPPLRQPYGLAHLPGQLTPVGAALANLARRPAGRDDAGTETGEEWA
ncbi:DNA-binding transcriptional regulator, LysR family [Streptoalloteichus tenebrarius]|uniref:DNA-binding transcriptional regulator, LysR family n=1 Tax=Streptoalloteichus tenebrarius (strain ATCC 17920 / DSM 40477 / JCM 4838 / CBS 697.72 / NBRC 16177 / NCIMB 11028 / NRRL B-12390 / A12253. 1 / ISP 5477) TaxID=1933 RepID=A0ABT1HWF6_STRSD|nr:LysR family transcriptional regulator [Streptoalloteichus tenebrarius]MCP2259839.1 DNA-binding transcriptional regulator, LysR family [Streptoalloteichus tenebrarius]BFE99211.1 LysR substrate-binding domain-containing protein [Streptoalloteichus tenebrarius]